VELETDGTKILDTIENHLDAKRGLSALPKSLHLLYADEVNVSPENSEFFVYAGIAVPGDRAGQLSEEIDELKKKCHLSPSEKPDHLNKRTTTSRISQTGRVQTKSEITESTAKI
jgi:hypothetical protein